MFLFHFGLKALSSNLAIGGAYLYSDADALQLMASQQCSSAAYKRIKDDIANETEQLDTPSGKFQRKGCRMTNAATLLAAESPNTVCPLNKFVPRYVGNALLLLLPSLLEHY